MKNALSLKGNRQHQTEKEMLGPKYFKLEEEAFIHYSIYIPALSCAHELQSGLENSLNSFS